MHHSLLVRVAEGVGHYARFESKLEQRISELRATLREELAQMAATLRQEIANLEIKLRGEIGAVESRLDKKFAALQAEVQSLKTMVRWLFGFWAASTVTILAAIIRMAGS